MKNTSRVLVLAAVSASAPAFAAVPTEVGAAITSQVAAAGEYGTAFIALAVASAAAGIAIKWIKKLMNKAT